MSHELYFICPHCGNRTKGTQRSAGLADGARGCERCGSAYLFELLDDYYPAPSAAFFTCDSSGRIVDCGRGAFELAGLKTEGVIGQPFSEALQIDFADGIDHIATALEWQVRVSGKPATIDTGNQHRSAIADIFPAYDDAEDRGLLVVLTPSPDASEQ